MKRLGLLVFAAIAIGLFFALGCAKGSESPTTPTPTPEPAPREVTVEILQGAATYDEDPTNDYSPNTIVVSVGTTVTWVNNDSMLHTVTAGDGSFDSGFTALRKKGDTWSYTFTKKGEFPYYCVPHPWMMGKIIVK